MKDFLKIHNDLLARQRAISLERDEFSQELEPYFAKACQKFVGQKILVGKSHYLVVGVICSLLVSEGKVLIVYDKNQQGSLSLSGVNADCYKDFRNGKISAVDCFFKQEYDDEQPYALSAEPYYIPMEKVIKAAEGNLEFTLS